jgi:hypothetical protein
MKPIQISDLLDHTAYERGRSDYVQRMIELKRPRRIPVGDKLTFVFENRETVRFQIQEMVRTEHIVKPEKIQDEIDVYNELIPKEHALSATLMIEILEQGQIRAELDRLIGIDEYIYLDIGDQRVKATFDSKQFEEDRIAAVQYVRFPIGRDLAAQFRNPEVSVRLRAEHPHYRQSTLIEGGSRASLTRDLEDYSESSGRT